MSQEIREIYDFGDFRLDADRRVVTRAGEPVSMTSKVYETLLFLVRNHDRVLSKDELMTAVWPDSFVEEVNLAQNISALRKALGESPGENRFIATVPGKGYRFVCEVRASGAEGEHLLVSRRTRAEVVVVEERDDGGGSLAAGETLALPAPRERFFQPRAFVLACVAFVCVLTVAGFLFWRQHTRAASAAPPGSLAVLPFQPLGSGSDDDHLGLGVADAVITKLSNIRELPVRPTDVVIRYSDSKTDPLEAARALGVDSVVSGKIQRSGDRIRVTVQLVRVRDGRALWAQTFDEQTAGIFVVEDSISEKIVQALAVNLASQERIQLQRHYTDNIDAYRNYLEGRYAEFTFTREGMNKAIEFFDRAVADDPSYALAYAGLADAYTTESDWLLPPREAMPKAETAARKALVFDDNLAEAHGALAHALLHEWRLSESEQEFHRALALNPQSVSTYFAYGEYLASIGRPDEAVAELEKALTIDPLSPEVNSFLAWDYYLMRDRERCLPAALKSIQMFPDFWLPHMAAGMCYYQRTQFPEAIREYQKAESMNPESTFSIAGEGMSLARSGQKSEAYHAIDRLKAMTRDVYVSPAYVALIYQVLGAKENEFAWYAKAYDDRAEWLLWLNIDPMFDGQRNDPRFVALVKRVGVSQQIRTRN
jgi:DNA-binding winged helix-turn-helix (wHTH) protein/TolB-like protein/Flp pilus assembly protein TadD